MSSSSESPPQSPVYPTTPPPSYPFMSPQSKRPLTPTSLRELSSPVSALTRSSSFPAPPTGHELMSLFPSAPPMLHDIHMVRYETEKDLRVVNGQYVNTSTWFGKEEREFFRGGVGEVTASKMEVTWESETSKAASKRRKSVDENAHVVLTSTSTLPMQVASRHPAHPPRSYPHSHPHASSIPHQAATLPVEAKPVTSAATGARRRAGKYTRRVFVQPSGAMSPSSPSSASSPSSYEGRSPPPPQSHSNSAAQMSAAAAAAQGTLVPVNWRR